MTSLIVGAMLLASGADATRPSLRDAFGSVAGFLSAGEHVSKGGEVSRETSPPYVSEYVEFPGIVDTYTTTTPSHEWVKVSFQAVHLISTLFMIIAE